MLFAGTTAAAGFGLLVGALFSFDHHQLFAVLLMACALSLFFVHGQTKCPKCRLHVYGKDGFGKFGELPKVECPRCGRTRRGVRPFPVPFRA